MAEPKFEKDLQRLEKIVEELEEGGLPLDESLKKFEEGIRLAKRCEKALGAAEKKIEILTKNAEGELEARPFGEVEGPETSGEDDNGEGDEPEASDEDDEDDEGDKSEDEDGELPF